MAGYGGIGLGGIAVGPGAGVGLGGAGLLGIKAATHPVLSGSDTHIGTSYGF